VVNVIFHQVAPDTGLSDVRRERSLSRPARPEGPLLSSLIEAEVAAGRRERLSGDDEYAEAQLRLVGGEVEELCRPA
jgi:hypothetical protein